MCSVGHGCDDDLMRSVSQDALRPPELRNPNAENFKIWGLLHGISRFLNNEG